jgi:hypothetical protein
LVKVKPLQFFLGTREELIVSTNLFMYYGYTYSETFINKKTLYCEPVLKVWIRRRVVGHYSSLPGTARNELREFPYIL